MKLSTNQRDFILILVLATIMGVLTCPPCMLSFEYAVKMEVIMVSIWLVMWYGNAYVSHLIDQYITWLDNPAKRFGLGIIGTAVYSTAAILLMALLFDAVFDIHIGDNWQLVWLSIGISVVILFFMLSKEFLYSWRDLALREEKMRNEVLVSRYEVLKSQINPHFMFNSLNALSSLVYENQDLAVEYINQLSKVFRYVLQAGKQEVVTLKEELEVLNSYIFLQKIRYNENLIVEIQLKAQTENYHVAPLVLQMLFENAIKHNEITKENPLRITISLEDEHLIIRNNLQPKDTALQESTEIGLSNIRDRYKSLSDKPVIIKDSANEFSVSIPLITTVK